MIDDPSAVDAEVAGGHLRIYETTPTLCGRFALQ